MSTEDLRYDGQVALITGAGRGLGREHALMLASRGCKVIVNDPGIGFDGSGKASAQIADQVVEEIKQQGGDAISNYDSVLQGEAIVSQGLDAFGRIDIVINNAGIVTPETWAELTLESWQKTIEVNLTGAFTMMKAVWPVLADQRYGRCVFTASPAIYGAGVAAYAASKSGVIGLANSLQFEAKKLKSDIKCNIIVPQANTRMVQDLNSSISEDRVAKGKSALRSAPPAVLDRLAPEQVSGLVAWLAHADCQYEAQVFEAAAGFFAQLHMARSAPLFVTTKEGVSGAPQPEHIRDGAETLADFANGDMPQAGDGAMGGPGPLEQVFAHLKKD